MGVTPREEEIIALHEEGKTPEQISGLMGISTSYAKARLAALTGTGSDRAWNSMVRMGTAMLGEAIQRHHPERCR